jgi:curli biogenesis system outer membrane secretion channel CsgG
MQYKIKNIVYLSIIMVFIFSMAFLFVSCGGGKKQTFDLAPIHPQSSSGKLVLGIMYFDNNMLSKDHDSLDRLRMGMVGALITELSKAQSITVVERDKIDDLRKEIEMQWKGDGFDQQTVQKFGKLLGAQALCFGQFMDRPEGWDSGGGCSIPFFTKKSKGEDLIRVDARIVVVETGAILKAEEITGQKQELFKLIKLLGLKVADRLETNLGVKVTPVDRKVIKAEDTVYSAVSVVKYEEAREQEQTAQVTLADSKLEDALKEAKELEAQRLFEDAKRKYEEALSISPEYMEAKKAIERLNQSGVL